MLAAACFAACAVAPSAVKSRWPTRSCTVKVLLLLPPGDLLLLLLFPVGETRAPFVRGVGWYLNES